MDSVAQEDRNSSPTRMLMTIVSNCLPYTHQRYTVSLTGPAKLAKIWYDEGPSFVNALFTIEPRKSDFINKDKDISIKEFTSYEWTFEFHDCTSGIIDINVPLGFEFFDKIEITGHSRLSMNVVPTPPDPFNPSVQRLHEDISLLNHVAHTHDPVRSLIVFVRPPRDQTRLWKVEYDKSYFVKNAKDANQFKLF